MMSLTMVRPIVWFTLCLLSLTLTSKKIEAQAQSAYDHHMRAGYAATARRDYPAALVEFTRAEAERPGDRFAEAAIQNVKSYLSRDLAQTSSNSSRLVFVPLASGLPTSRISAAVRGEACATESDVSDLIPLTPAAQVGLTVTSRPQVMVYLPEVPPAGEAIFAFDGALYRLTLPPTSGVISIEVPEALEPNQTYQWGLALLCSSDPAKNPTVTGKIQHITLPALTDQLASAPVQDHWALYRVQGVWYDTVAALGRSRQSNPQLQAEWETVLQAEQLGKIAQAPLLECCSLP